MTLALLFPTILAATTGHAGVPRPVMQAVWKATSAGARLHGNVSAQATSAAGNAVVGSWTLANDDGVITLHGTWSGKRLGTGWHGTWQAKVDPGGSFAGTWQAAPPADFHGRTFEDLLRATGEVQISGSWTSRGGNHGFWWLQSAAP